LPPSGQARRGEAFRTPPGSKDSNGKEESSGAADPLPGYFFIQIILKSAVYYGAEYNPRMSSSSIIKIILGLIAGIAMGVFYGWVIDPVEYVDVTPEVLRTDYKTDFVLMVAEAYASDFEAETAARRLAMLGSDTPASIVTAALEYATLNNFTETEILSLQNLLTAMQTYRPEGNTNP